MKSISKSRVGDAVKTLLFMHASADLYGSDVTLLQLVRGLDQGRFDSIVVVPYEGPLVPLLQDAGAEVIVRDDLPIIRRQYMNPRGLLHLAASLKSVWWLYGLIRRRDVALVHGNTLATALLGLAAKLARRPQVWHVHEITTKPRAVASALATLSSALSTRVVANSQATAEHYRRTRLAGSTPVMVILNGVEEDHIHNRSEKSLEPRAGVRRGETVFTLIGRINRWKGHSVFLDAAERLANDSGEAKFLIVGDSFAGQEHLTEAVNRRIESSKVLRDRASRLPYAPAGDIYEASDVVVVPSIEPEPFGLVAAEAMAAGLPVIASRVGALPEIVEDGVNGLLVSPNDPGSLLAAMKRLQSSPSLRVEMGRRGRETFEERFRAGRYVEEFAGVYEEIIA